MSHCQPKGSNNPTQTFWCLVVFEMLHEKVAFCSCCALIIIFVCVCVLNKKNALFYALFFHTCVFESVELPQFLG